MRRKSRGRNTYFTWTGDDPSREGLLDTPKRVAEGFEEFFFWIQAGSMFDLTGWVFPSWWVQRHNLGAESSFLFSLRAPHDSFFGHASIAYVPQPCGRLFLFDSSIAGTQSTASNPRATHAADCGYHSRGSCTQRSCCTVVCWEHLCMSMRGIRQVGVQVKTHAFSGLFTQDTYQREV